MDLKKNCLQPIQKDHVRDESNPPPAYINCQPNASAPAQPSTAIHLQTTIAAPAAAQIIPINAMAFLQPMGPKSMEMICPSCRCRITTRVRHRSTSKTHMVSVLLFWTCCCCCLPYCMDSCRNANHFCPMCEAYIGTYSS